MTQDEKESAAPSTAATESAALTAVTALMEQRRRYEGWIAAMDAKRDVTAPHVFERVNGDYVSRLQVVIKELSEHADELRTEMEALEGRLHVIEQDQQRAEDERAEGELRAHVGELSTEDWSTASTASDDRLAELAMSRGEVERELSRTRELLDDAQRPAVPSPEVRAAPAPEGSSASPTTEGAGPDVSGGVPAGASAAAAVHEQEPMELSASVIAAEQQLIDIEEAQSGAPATDAAAVPATGASDDVGRFDELAFLSSVVDAPLGDVENGPSDRPDEKARRNSFAQDQVNDDIVNLSDKRRTPLDHMRAQEGIEQEGDPPFASNVTGNYPIKLTENPAEGAKTLKCGDCGAMNYPTEWYCERCGAELASL
ncbi:MAG: zinc finger Ran-binding domain-containing protein [bacterium]